MKDITTREKDIYLRELRAYAMEMIMAEDMPVELLDILVYNDEASVKKSYEIVKEVVNNAVHEILKEKLATEAPKTGGNSDGLEFGMQRVFRPKLK